LGKIKINLPNESFFVNIAGDQPTIEEELKLAKLIQSRSGPKTDQLKSAAPQQEQLFDTKTGIQDFGLRSGLSLADDEAEQEASLQKRGLGEGDYTRDNRGRLAITPQGGVKLGLDLEKPTLIDEEGFSMSDITSDLTTFIGDIGGGVAGTLGGAALGTAILPGIGTFIGGVLGAGVGTATGDLVEEGVEILSGVSRQTAQEIANDAKVNFLIGAGSEFAIGGAIRIVAPFFRGLKGQQLPDEDIILAGQSIKDFGIDPSIGAIGGSPLVARQQKIGETIFGGSKRLKQNYNSMINKINKYKDEIGVPVGSVTEREAGQSLVASIASKNAALKQAEMEAKESVISTFDQLAVDMGAAAVKDEQINQNVFSTIAQSLKNFDEISATKFSSIDEAINSVIGSSKIIKTGKGSAIKEKAKLLQERFKAAIAAGGLSPKSQSEAAAAQAIINGIGALGEKSSFAQIYALRRELFDAKFSFAGTGGGKLLDDAVNLVDDLLSPTAIEDAVTVSRAAGMDLTEDNLSILRKAADELPGAKAFFRQGQTAIEKMQAATGIKDLQTFARKGEIPPNVDFMKQIIKKGQPESLRKSIDVVRKNMGGDAANQFRRKLASEYLRDAISAAGTKADDPLTFKGSAFSNAIDDLGETGKVLFGDDYGKIKNLSNQIRQTTMAGTKQAVDVERSLAALVGNQAPDALVDTMRNLAKAQSDAFTAKRNSIFKRIASGQFDDSVDEVVGFVTAPKASASEISSIMNVLDDTQREQIKSIYMQNILDDFGSDVMIKGDSLKKFANTLSKAAEGGKLQAVFGKEMGDDMAKFAKVLTFNTRGVNGGDLVAANIAASPLQNIGAILRFGVIGNLLSSRFTYRRVLKDYERLSKGLSTKEKAATFGKVLAAALVQTPGQVAEEGTREAERQISNLIENSPSLTPAPASGIGQVDPTQPLGPNIAAAGNTSSIRQQAAQNPAVAQTLGINPATATLLGTGP